MGKLYLTCGDFILRIEDTDQEREVECAIDFIYNTLDLCGFKIDEVPNNEKEYGSYIQSKRKDIYKEYAYKKLKSKTSNLKFDDNIVENEFNKWKAKFVNCLEDDLNTANGITVLYNLLKSDVNIGTKYRLVSDFDEVLSLDLLKSETKKIQNEDEILAKINERTEAKNNKDYDKADKIREELLNMGIIIKDTREGTTYEAI